MGGEAFSVVCAVPSDADADADAASSLFVCRLFVVCLLSLQAGYDTAGTSD